MEKRCFWANSSELLRKYHDEEWGKPLHDERRLFEMLILEGKSCGLSWELILKKRDHMEKIFDNFDPNAIIGYDDAKILKEFTPEDATIVLETKHENATNIDFLGKDMQYVRELLDNLHH